MLKTRVIPCLLLRNGALVKTVRFRDAQYVGDPINTVRIFNEKEVDELIFLDINATPERKSPQFDLIREIAVECFMPFAYGGGVRSLADAKRVMQLGAEKVCLNTILFEDPTVVSEIAAFSGSQSVVASIDVRKRLWGRPTVFVRGGRVNTGVDPVEYAIRAERLGAGEILLTSINQDGTFAGYDLDLIERVSSAVSVPVVACGGAGKLSDFPAAVQHGASALAVGSMVVYQGSHRSVLINFPSKQRLKELLGND